MIGMLRRLLGQESDLDRLEKRIGRRFRRRALLVEALTHTSYAREHRGAVDNERLEFLGDAVLQLVATEHIYRRRTASEGEMTKTRSGLVSADGLLRIADDLELPDFILLGKGEKKAGGDRKRKILEDAVEAVIGALYLDGGMRTVRRFLMARWEGVQIEAPLDHKTQAQEAYQRTHRITPRYRVARTSGPAHARHFVVEMMVKDLVVGTGEGSSIKRAEQEAARHAIESLRARAEGLN